jgi:FkbM family methyltransferase
VIMEVASLKPTIKLLLGMLHLERLAGALYWRLRQLGAGINLCRDYRKAFGVIRGTKLYFHLHSRRFPVGSIISADIGRNLPALVLRAATVDVTVFEQVFIHRQYDFDVSSNPSLIIDGGAHIGCASVFWALKFPRAIIYSIEPEAGNFVLLRQNLEKYRNSIPLQAALWSRPTSLKIVDTAAQSWNYQIAEQVYTSSSPEDVLALTIDEIFNWTGAEAIDILKLDIEGSEKEIFTTEPKQWLAHVTNLAIELHDRMVAGCEDAMRKATAPFHFTELISGECVVLQRSGIT